MLSILGLGAASVGITACGGSASTSDSSRSSGTSAGEIPDETAGPYPGDGSNGPDVLEESGIVRSDIRSSFGSANGTAKGVPMTLELTIADLANDGVPFEGVAVYVWHCTREGTYSMYSDGVEDENFLRGVQIADASGKAKFTSIFPACYAGRWPHIHFEVYRDKSEIDDAKNAIATSQVALPKHICTKVYAENGYERSVTNLSQVSLGTDNVFGDDGAKSQLATVSGNVRTGFQVALSVGVDTTTEPSGGGAPGGSGSPDDGAPPDDEGPPDGGAPPDGEAPPDGGSPPTGDEESAS